MPASEDNIELFQVPYVPSLNYTRIPDPLIKVKNSVTINPGISQMFIFKISGINESSSQSVLKISSGSKDVNIYIDVQVKDLIASEILDSINANVWAYLNYPLLKDRKSEAVADLTLHHINTIVIPPPILPDLLTTDYTPFINYLKNFKNIKNILLFMDYSNQATRNGYKNGSFMSPEWKSKFLNWYNNITKLITENGFSNSKVYLYPYDEVSGKNTIDFENLINWSKTNIPGIQFYATLYDEDAIDQLIKLKT